MVLGPTVKLGVVNSRASSSFENKLKAFVNSKGDQRFGIVVIRPTLSSPD